MKNFCLTIALAMTAQVARSETNVVYGIDNRKDVYQVKDSNLLKLAKSSAAMIPGSLFTKTAKPYIYNLTGTQTLERAENICTSEAFSQQPTAPICSGFLVGEDTLITAGHCYNGFATPEQICNAFYWVFDYQLTTASTDPTKNIPIQNIYFCKQILSNKLDSKNDYTIIKLDRKVTGREPLKFRKYGKVPDSSSLVVIGHPTGLPTKISDGGKVTNNSDSSFIVTNLDTFHGNSGSAVFDATTGLVEGILVMGKTDYRPSIPTNPNSCQVLNKCDDNGQKCDVPEESNIPGELVYRITNISSMIQNVLRTPVGTLITNPELPAVVPRVTIQPIFRSRITRRQLPRIIISNPPIRR